MKTIPLSPRTLVIDGFRVLRRTDRAAEIPMLLVGYDETAESRSVEHPDGIVAPTVFARSPHFVSRFTKLGWVEVTEQWVAPAVAAPVEEQVEEKPARKPARRRAVRRATGS